MRVYERLWHGFFSVVMAVGLAAAVLEWSVVGLVVTLVALVALCSAAQYVLPDVLPGCAPAGGARRAFSGSLTASVGIVTVWSFGRVTPALALLVLLTAGSSSPAVVRRALRAARTPAGAPVGEAPGVRAAAPRPAGAEASAGLTPPEAMGPLLGLDDRQVCRLWRESFWVLGEPAPPATVLRLVALREACLDELERRHADGLHAWLDSGARASSGPEKYLGRDGSPCGGSAPGTTTDRST